MREQTTVPPTCQVKSEFDVLNNLEDDIEDEKNMIEQDHLDDLNSFVQKDDEEEDEDEEGERLRLFMELEEKRIEEERQRSIATIQGKIIPWKSTK